MPKRNLVFAVALFILVGVLSLRGSLPSVQSDTWAATGNMNEARADAAAALLPDGRLLVTGGAGSNGATSSAEVFNPTGSFSNVAPMVHARSHHAAVALLDGRVLWREAGQVAAALPTVRKCTTRLATRGRRWAPWPPHARATPPRCLKMAAC